MADEEKPETSEADPSEEKPETSEAESSATSSSAESLDEGAEATTNVDDDGVDPEGETVAVSPAETAAAIAASQELAAVSADESVGEDSAAAIRAGHDPGAHDHGAHDHGGHDHFAHTSPMSLLVGVLIALVLLTILTVGVTAIDLGAQGNFIVAMIIATVKAALVMGYFMHMVWDNKFNVVAFTSSFLFVLLFLAMALTDRGEYQDSIDTWEVDNKSVGAE